LLLQATVALGPVSAIEWINNDVFAHTATAKNGDFDVMLPPKQTGSFIVKKTGEVDYYCRFHPNMKAVLK
jgi:plastocyanin